MSKNRRAALRAEGEEVKSHRHSVNPFTEGWQPEVIHKARRINLDKRSPIFDGEGNQLKGALLVPMERDAGRFVKLAHGELRILHRLSSTARAVLDFAMSQTLPNNAVVWMPADEGCEWCHFKQPKSFYDGVTELIIYEYLARTERQGFYFLNPRRFVNGRRTHLKNTFSKPKR